MSTNLADALVIWANGWLAAAYWTWDSAALLLTIGIAILITGRYDREVRRTAGERVRRYGRGQVIIASRRSLYETLAVLAVWSLAASVTAPPIPFIGLLMWLAFLIALRLIPQEREQILFRQKVMIGIYAVCLIAFRIVTAYSFDAGQLSTMLGGDADTAGLFASVRGSITPYLILVLWVMYPLGYFSVIAQRFAINRGSLTRPGKTVADTLQDLRTRGE
jgi:hypothetical protein